MSQLLVTVTDELPLAAKEVSGSLSELGVLEATTRDPAVLDLRVKDIADAPLPMVGVGMTVSELTRRLSSTPGVLVLDGGHPVGVLTRSDMLGFLQTEERDMSGFNTRAIHVGSEPDPDDRCGQPARLSHFDLRPGRRRGASSFSDYGRVDNPTRAALETCLANLEEAEYGVAFASGLAGEDALLRTLSPGDQVILGNDAYGGTYRLLTRIFGEWGIETVTVDLADTDAVRAAFDPSTKMLWVETPSNPLLNVVSIAALSRRSPTNRRTRSSSTTRSRRPTCSARSTLGADVVVHSTTKYIGGHSDVLGGFVATNNEDLAAALEVPSVRHRRDSRTA